MKRPVLYLSALVVLFGFWLAASHNPTFAQSQATDGQIEGSVLDQNKAAVPNVVIVANNVESGSTRTTVSDENGIYRFPLLPSGTYRLVAEAANFKKYIREGIILAAGQVVTVTLDLETGEVQEAVTVSSDASVVDAGKIDLGRTINSREAQNLPLITRNPFNFAVLQANVTGRPGRGFAPANISVNGYLGRVHYLLDGNTNTQGDQGVRLMLISDTYVSEIQLVTNGFAAEFGNTPGMIMNVVTPSGTNNFHGAISYLYRGPSFYTRPFFYSGGELPDSHTDDLTVAVGGPIRKDRWHFYFGTEHIKRDDSAAADRLIVIRESDKARLIEAGVSPSIFPPSIPSVQTASFYIFRTDAQLNENNRFTVRSNHSDTLIKNFVAGGLNTLERSGDTRQIDYGLAVQLASYTTSFVNEFRFQYAQRGNGRECRNQFSGTGPSIVITGVANFGSPDICADGIPPPRRITQLQENWTRSTGAHMFKLGGGFNYYSHTERSVISSVYTFGYIEDYIAARRGERPLGYTSYTETSGNPNVDVKATYWNFFVQDDWKPMRRSKILFGVRYDLYQIPKADPMSPFPGSQKFKVDKNNLAPRLGVVYALREGIRPTILRAGAGMYYDQPLLAMYRRAIQNNGSSKFVSLSLTPSSTTHPPLFPNTFSGTVPPLNIDAIAADFENMYAIHSNIQVEQAVTEDLSLSAGFVHSGGRHIPVYRQANCRPVGGTLADGRPLFGSSVLPVTHCTIPVFPQFANILMAESVGVSAYNAFTLQVAQRFSRGLQFSANYTLSKAEDDAPEQNMVLGNSASSDPTNRSFDKGNSFADQRHTFVMSLVVRPQFALESRVLRHLFNQNQFGIIATANSGERFNIVSDLDLNRDGIFGDRPVGITRNSGNTPSQYTVDLRYSRFFNVRRGCRLEAFAEFQNFLNINSIVRYNNVTVATNPTDGQMIGELPDFKARNQSTAQTSRQVQIGLRFTF